jgi:3-oxoacyl-[acyl-carrier-protein] synthase II
VQNEPFDKQGYWLMSRRIVVTGLGVVSPVGNTTEVFWDALLRGTSGIGPITGFDTTNYACKIAGEVKDIDFSQFVEAKEVKRTDRAILMAVAASDQAIRDAGLDKAEFDRERCGVMIGSGIGGINTLETEHTKLMERGPGRVSPFLVPMMITDMTAGMVSIKHGLKGPNFSVVSACASGGHSIGTAMLYLQAGLMDIAVTGGAEATIVPICIAGFCSMKAVSTRNELLGKASCPFDKKRDGFVMGEGAGIVVLETLEHAQKRGVRIYAEVIGYGATGDAYHISAPDPEGDGAARVMQMALQNAGIQPSAIDYINAHGTSTPLNDKLESMAIQRVFGEHSARLNISSTKSMTGHLLGASGGVEFIASVLTIRDSIIHPTINYEDPDPECPLNYTPNTAVKRQVTCAMSNSFGFGGHNASLIVKKYDPTEKNG